MSVGVDRFYDRAPHQWLKDMPEAVKVPRNVTRMVGCVMGMWQTNFMISGEPEHVSTTT